MPGSRPRRSKISTLAFAAALALPTIGLLVYNASTTGSPTTLGYQLSLAGWRSARIEPSDGLREI